jgi:hypothetical protein
VTGLISSALLVVPRVLNWFLLARRSHVRGLPFAMFAKAPALPNTVDKDWRFKAEVYKGLSAATSRKLNVQSEAAATELQEAAPEEART